MLLSEISVLCEISDLLLFVSYFASQSKGLKDSYIETMIKVGHLVF